MRTINAAVWCLVLTTVACSSPSGPGDQVVVGTWGGEHVALELTADGGRVEYDCAHGALDEPLAVDRAGRFDVTGAHTAEHGGPVRDDDTSVARPARFTGNVEGGRMTLTVMLMDTGEKLGTFTLTRGLVGRVTKCL